MASLSLYLSIFLFLSLSLSSCLPTSILSLYLSFSLPLPLPLSLSLSFSLSFSLSHPPSPHPSLSLFMPKKKKKKIGKSIGLGYIKALGVHQTRYLIRSNFLHVHLPVLSVIILPNAIILPRVQLSVHSVIIYRFIPLSEENKFALKP